MNKILYKFVDLETNTKTKGENLIKIENIKKYHPVNQTKLHERYRFWILIKLYEREGFVVIITINNVLFKI